MTEQLNNNTGALLTKEEQEPPPTLTPGERTGPLGQGGAHACQGKPNDKGLARASLSGKTLELHTEEEGLQRALLRPYTSTDKRGCQLYPQASQASGPDPGAGTHQDALHLRPLIPGSRGHGRRG